MAGRNINVSEASRPVLPRHAKLKFDETRQVWVILAPERVLAPDEIAVEVLQLCDGIRSVEEMIDQLAEKYNRRGSAIGTDVIAMLQEPCRQRDSHGSAREDVMSSTLTDAKAAAGDPLDGLAVLEGRGSSGDVRDSFGRARRTDARCPCSALIAPIRWNSTAAAANFRPRNGRRCSPSLAEIGVAANPFFRRRAARGRKDLVELVQHASDVGLYSNLITSAVLLTREKLVALADAGLCHVQISFQGNEPGIADRVARLKMPMRKSSKSRNGHAELDLPLTVNAVMHRQNLHQLPDIIRMAVDLDADGWKSPMFNITVGR